MAVDEPVQPQAVVPGDEPTPAVEADLEDLPARPVSHCRLVHKIRRMDDPEILARVLAGLLTLP